MPGSFRFRTFQQKLGFYSFALSFFCMLAVSSLTYLIARNQVQADRVLLLEAYARQIKQEVEKELGDAIQEARLWGELNYSQEGLKEPQGDRITAFLDDLVKHHQEYDLIFMTDKSGRIVHVNELGSPYRGRSYQELLPMVPPSFLAGVAQSGNIQGFDWSRLDEINTLLKRRADTPREQQYQILLATPIREHGGADILGAFVAVLNWSRIQRVLDRAQAGMNKLDLHSGYAFLLDSDADTTIGHKYRDLYGKSTSRDHKLPQLRDRARDKPEGMFQYEWREGPKLVALEKIDVPELGPSFAWRLGVGVNDAEIFAPVYSIMYRFLIISLAVALFAAILSVLAGQRLTVSLNEFAQLARDAAQGHVSRLVRSHSDDELGDLAKAFNEMLVSIRTKIPFVQIPNPYVVGNPLRGQEMFFGRQEDLDWIQQRLERRGNEMILLFGPQRIGKTSMLHQICRGRAGAKVLPFFFDTQQIIPELQQDADFYHLLTREMLLQMPQSARAFIAADRYTAETFRRLLKFLHESQPDRIAVLLFDEIENLEYKFKRGTLTSSVLFFLAALLDGEIPVSFVATGSEQLENLEFADWKILTKKTIPRRISLLNPKEARRLIMEPVQGYVLYDEGLPESILRLTAGHPYYTQLLCQTTVDYLNQNQRFSLSQTELHKITQLVLDNPPLPLNHLWEQLSPLQKTTVAALAKVLEDGQAHASPKQIHAAIPEELLDEALGPAHMLSALGQLCNQDWLEDAGPAEYRFRADLFRLWIRQEHSIWHVIDELRGSSTA